MCFCGNWSHRHKQASPCIQNAPTIDASYDFSRVLWWMVIEINIKTYLFFCILFSMILFLCVTTLTVLELVLIYQTNLKLIESVCLCFPSTGIKACATTTWISHIYVEFLNQTHISSLCHFSPKSYMPSKTELNTWEHLPLQWDIGVWFKSFFWLLPAFHLNLGFGYSIWFVGLSEILHPVG